jgi:hypothetical protein
MNEWIWSIGGMILTGENWSTGRGTLYSVCARWMNEYGALVEWYWQGKTEVLGDWVGPKACLDGCGKSRPMGRKLFIASTSRTVALVSKFPTYPHHVMPVQVFTPTNKWNVWLTHKLQARELHPLKMPCTRTTAAHTVRVITLQNKAFKKCSLNTWMGWL